MLAVSIVCLSGSMNAQDKSAPIKKIDCTQSYPSNPITLAYDGKTETIWHSPYSGYSSTTTFPVEIKIELKQMSHVDYIEYIPRQDGNDNGNWGEVDVAVRQNGKIVYNTIMTIDLKMATATAQINLNGTEGLDSVSHIRLRIKNGANNFASAAEIGLYQRDNSKMEAFSHYFEDKLCTRLRDNITSADGIEDADVKALVSAILTDKNYNSFRVGEYEPYRTTASLQNELRTSGAYNNYENPTGIYAHEGKQMIVFMDGIDEKEPVQLLIKNWLTDERRTTYALHNGLNIITPTSTGNCFINYYTDNYAFAPNVKAHFACGEIQGYWDQQTMTNDDWKHIMALHPSDKDSTIVIVRSQHAQLAYPAFIYNRYCPTNIDSLMHIYQNIQWAERNMMGLSRFGRECKNRQLFYASTYGFMAATGWEGSYCHVGSLGAITRPDAKEFDFWGVGHEWGHNNQINPGFVWNGTTEVTNNIYASWAQFLFNYTDYYRLEDEKCGINDFAGMRGGRMQSYFEEGLRKGKAWMMQEGPDNFNSTPQSVVVQGVDYDGKPIGNVTAQSRGYDVFVMVCPFWQLNMWGTAAGKCPDIIPSVIEGLRSMDKSVLGAMTPGQQRMNWMRLACEKSGLNLLPFFEKCGMLKPCRHYASDYTNGWNMINEKMIDELKTFVAEKGYPEPNEELQYVTGHNHHIYKNNLHLSVPSTMGDGCTLSGSTVKVLHSIVKNAVAFETYNSHDELIRITMYALGSDDQHSYTQVLYPGAEDASYIMAVGYDGERKKIYEYTVPQLIRNEYYTLLSNSKGGYLTTQNSSVNKSGKITWSLIRTATATDPACVFMTEERNGKMYLLNPQSGGYITGSANTSMSALVNQSSARAFIANLVDLSRNTWTLQMEGEDQYLNSYSNTETGFWYDGSNDANNIWILKKAETINVTIPEIGFKAVNYPFGIEIPEGTCSAFIATQVMEKDNVTYVVINNIGKHLPANTPAILINTDTDDLTNGKSATLKLNIVRNDAPLSLPNILLGTNLKCTGFSLNEIMSIKKNASTSLPGFAPSATTSVAANSSYLMSNAASSASTVFILSTDEAVNISDVISDLHSSDLYDLTGKQVKALKKGVFITKSGKKIWVK